MIVLHQNALKRARAKAPARRPADQI